VTILPRAGSLPVAPRAQEVATAFFGEGGDADASAGHAIAGEKATLEACYSELAPRILRFQRDLLGDATLARDAMQETFIRAFHRVGELPAGTRLVPWVFGIARNVCLELRRARGRFRRIVVEFPAKVQAEVADTTRRSPEAELLDREALLVVARALEALSEERRAVLLLRLDHGLAYEDIAELMGWSLAKVKVEIHRAREVLRARMDEYRGGVP
jgi:RNA polymerase sigma-70 factor (ECF subfamily)